MGNYSPRYAAASIARTMFFRTKARLARIVIDAAMRRGCKVHSARYTGAMTLQELIDHFGSQGKVARALGLRQPSVSSWKDKGVPPLRQLQFEAITRGRLKADPAVKQPKAPEQVSA